MNNPCYEGVQIHPLRQNMYPNTGDIKFHFRYTPFDVWDFDGVNELVLTDLGSEKVWLHGDRNGFLYKTDRTNGKFKYSKEISKVNWATRFTPEGRPVVNPEKVPTYDYEAKDICPASEGSKWWNPMSYSPAKKMVFVPSREICTDIKSAKGTRAEGLLWRLKERVSLRTESVASRLAFQGGGAPCLKCS